MEREKQIKAFAREVGPEIFSSIGLNERYHDVSIYVQFPRTPNREIIYLDSCDSEFSSYVFIPMH